MPIRKEYQDLYGPAWTDLSNWVRFERAGGRCEHCTRPHGQELLKMPDGRVLDPMRGYWVDIHQQRAEPPSLIEQVDAVKQPLYLAAAHLDQNPQNNDPSNLAALCPMCHLNHDRSFHRQKFRRTIRMRYAVGDLFEGLYDTTALVPPSPVVELPIRREPVLRITATPVRQRTRRETRVAVA